MSADLLTQVILPFSLFLIMFGLGLTLTRADFKQILLSPKAVVVGILGQLLLLPFVAFVLAVLFRLPPELAIGLMIISTAPGGATSNMYSYLFKGDVSLSITLTAVVSLITPFTLPLVIAASMVYFIGSGTDIQLPIVKTIIQLLIITIIPVTLGMIVLARWAGFAKKAEQVLKWFSIAFLALIIVLIILKNRQDMLSFFAQAGLATLTLNVCVLILGYALAQFAQLTQAQKITIGFEVGLQNGTLALVVASSIIGNEVMAIPAVTYSIIMFITGALFGRVVNRT